MDLNALNNVRAWTNGVEVEYDAVAQVKNIASLPIVAGHVAIMPDVHLGKGATVGSVIPTRGAIIPAAVGVDIGCGMCAVRTVLSANELPDSLSKIRATIEARVPVGFSAHEKPVSTHSDGLFGIALKRKGDELYDRYQRLRIMDRQFTLDDLRKQTEGVECRKDAGVLDEIPGAYKDIDAVMAAQADLVEVVHTLKQIMCIKG